MTNRELFLHYCKDYNPYFIANIKDTGILYCDQPCCDKHSCTVYDNCYTLFPSELPFLTHKEFKQVQEESPELFI